MMASNCYESVTIVSGIIKNLYKYPKINQIDQQTADLGLFYGSLVLAAILAAILDFEKCSMINSIHQPYFISVVS